MRIAVFSDVHGNRFALEAVLRGIEAQKPDAIANLGDQVWGGADPAGAWKLQQKVGAVTVRGNTDEFLSLPLEELEQFRALGEWLHTQLPPAAPATLMALPVVAELAGGAVVIAHGSLDNPSDALMLTREGGGARPATLAEMVKRTFAYPSAKVFVVGHTHTEMLFARDGKTFVNAGAVSRQGYGDPAARWVLLEEQNGAWSVSFRRVPYDTEAAARWALANCPVGEQEAEQLRTGKIGNTALR